MCFIKLLAEKRSDLEGLKGRLAAGLDKLLTTAGEVEVMQLELVALQPILATTAKEADNMMETISIDKADADVTKQEVCYKELSNLSVSLSFSLSLSLSLLLGSKGTFFLCIFPQDNFIR
jgi:DMSO reductase anchor subunit